MMDLQSRASIFVKSFPSISGAIAEANRIFELNYYSRPKSTRWQDLQRGKIYTFDYELPSDEMTPGGFIDRRPLAIIIPPPGGYPRFNLFGLDLNLLPPVNRSRFISKYADVTGLTYELDGNIKNFPDPDKTSRLSLQNASMLTMEYPISRIVKGFDVQYVSGFIEVIPDDWFLIPYLNDFKIQGTTINKIYNS
jgi:hypothetical protein